MRSYKPLKGQSWEERSTFNGFVFSYKGFFCLFVFFCLKKVPPQIPSFFHHHVPLRAPKGSDCLKEFESEMECLHRFIVLFSFSSNKNILLKVTPH